MVVCIVPDFDRVDDLGFPLFMVESLPGLVKVVVSRVMVLPPFLEGLFHGKSIQMDDDWWLPL